MLRPVEAPDDLVLLIRAAPDNVEETIEDIAEDARDSADRYVIEGSAGERELLFGVSVFARSEAAAADEVLRRFARAPAYLEAPVGTIRRAGFSVLPTGDNTDHFDVQLIAGRVEEEGLAVILEVRQAAERLVRACGDLRPNPAYASSHQPLPEEPS